jgi:membrane-associated phospholipid phosphatase
MPSLRPCEWITLLAFSWFTTLACFRRKLDKSRRVKIIALGLIALGITIFVSLVLPRMVTLQSASIVRDWVPYLFLFMFYSQGGQFVTVADTDLEARLARLDHRIVAPLLEWCARNSAGFWILTYLEMAYFSYYPVLPTALVVLYVSGRQAEAAQFWTVVLLAAYGSCGTLPFVQTRPPRVLGEKWSASLPFGRMRAFNLLILRLGSIQANTLPSAHVAITTACALSLMWLGPIWGGVILLVIAMSIAFGAVTGRYHYAADAMLGTLVACAALLLGATLFASSQRRF